MGVVVCPSCRGEYEVDRSHYGMTVTCVCGVLLAVGHPEDSAPAPAAPAVPTLHRGLGATPAARGGRTEQRVAHAPGKRAAVDAARRKPYAVTAMLMVAVAGGSALAPWVWFGVTSLGISPFTLARLLTQVGGDLPPDETARHLAAVAALGSFGHLLGVALAVAGGLGALRDWRSGWMTGGFLTAILTWSLWWMAWERLVHTVAAAPAARDIVTAAEAAGVGLSPFYWVAGSASFVGLVTSYVAQTMNRPFVRRSGVGTGSDSDQSARPDR